MRSLIFERFKRYMDVSHHDPEIELSGRVFRFIVFALFGAFSFFSLHYFSQGLFQIATLQAAVATVAFISFYIFKKTGSIVYAGNFFLSLGIISAFMRVYLMGGINSPAFFIWPVIPVCTMLLLPPRWSIFWTSCYVLIAVGFHGAHRLGHDFPSVIATTSLESIRIVSLVVVMFLLTLITHLFKRLNSHYRKLIIAKTEEKTNLVRLMTHDIASPIMVLNYNVKTLEKKIGASAELTKIKMAIDSIRNLSTEVRELEAIQSGKKKFNIKSEDIIPLINEVLLFHEVALEEKSLRLALDFQGLSQARALIDPRSFQNQILNNLISNAIKFTEPHGQVKISLRKERGFLLLSISDTGIGIPQDLIGKIFDSTKQTTRLGTNGELGTGFGMPILKSTIERIGGRISIQSRAKEEFSEGHGTSVTLELNAQLD